MVVPCSKTKAPYRGRAGGTSACLSVEGWRRTIGATVVDVEEGRGGLTGPPGCASYGDQEMMGDDMASSPRNRVRERKAERKEGNFGILTKYYYRVRATDISTYCQKFESPLGTEVLGAQTSEKSSLYQELVPKRRNLFTSRVEVGMQRRCMRKRERERESERERGVGPL